MELYLRKANRLDKKTIYEFANDPETRKNSFNTESIPWEAHEKWYEKQMELMEKFDSSKKSDASSKPEVFIWLAMDFMKPIGNVRLNIQNQIATISYSVAPDCRGLGIGKKMLLLMEKEIAGLTNAPKYLRAEVKKENLASIRIFEALGYQKEKSNNKANAINEDVIIFKKDVQEKKEVVKQIKELQQQRKNREVSFEVLRVIAMLMVITLHYMSKGKLLDKNLLEDNSLCNWLHWTMESFCLAAVNVYVLISGYFLVDHKFRLSKVAELWCQIFFYSIGITLLMILAGMVNYRDYMDLFQIQFFVFPVINGHYWFASSYILLYLFAPFLGRGVRNLSKKQHGLLIYLLLTVFCFSKSVLPFAFPYDDLGNGIIWFLCLFIIAAYIRLYGIKFLEKKVNSLCVYLLSVGAILLSFGVIITLVKQTGKFEDAMLVPCNYNFIFVLTSSLGLFTLFKRLNFKDNFITRFLARIAPYTFGVYLLHEHLLLRYEWPKWFQVSQNYGHFRIIHLLLTVLIIFVVGILVDMIRKIISDVFQKLMAWALKIYYAKREVWDYLIFGALTTVVNWIAYVACAYFLLIPLLEKGTTNNAMVSNTIAWIAAVLFAYWTNRSFVFHSEVTEGKALFKEFIAFVGARVFSFLVEQAMFFIMVNLMKINDLVSKLVIGIVVIILNYIFSKLWIFKDKNKIKNQNKEAN